MLSALPESSQFLEAFFRGLLRERGETFNHTVPFGAIKDDLLPDGGIAEFRRELPEDCAFSEGHGTIIAEN